MRVEGEGFTATVSEDGKTMTIVIDLDRQGTPSRSGKNLVIATTRGNMRIGPVTVGLNVYKRREG